MSSQERSSSLEGPPPPWTIEIPGNPFPPKGWRPPDKNYGGQDLTHYFTLLLLERVFSSIIDENRRRYPQMSDAELAAFLRETPTILKGAKQIVTEADQITESLNREGHYFYQGGGSVFGDYKLMRARAYLALGGYSNPDMTRETYANIWNKDQQVQEAWKKGVTAMRNMFYEGMTTEEAYNVAREIINRYWWGNP